MAKGTVNNNIIFSSNQSEPEAGDWGGLKFNADSVDGVLLDETYIRGSILDNCEITYGGDNVKSSITIDASIPYIRNCVISHSASGGIFVENSCVVPLRTR